MNNPNEQERRKLIRRMISYYFAIVDNSTQKVIGHLVDISPAGLLMDSKIPIPTNQTFTLRLDFMEDINGKASLEITARSKWCRQDEIQPFVYNAGFEIIDLDPGDLDIVKLIAMKYGAG
jgi:hypothetical protein